MTEFTLTDSNRLEIKQICKTLNDITIATLPLIYTDTDQMRIHKLHPEG